MECSLNAADIAEHAESLVTFHSAFTPFFQTKTRDVSAQALDYLKGQFLCVSNSRIIASVIHVAIPS
mgnify:CR=1 FL=1